MPYSNGPSYPTHDVDQISSRPSVSWGSSRSAAVEVAVNELAPATLMTEKTSNVWQYEKASTLANRCEAARSFLSVQPQRIVVKLGRNLKDDSPLQRFGIGR